MEIESIDYDFSVCKVKDFSMAPFYSEFCFIAKTDEENSLVCMTEDVPKNVIERDDGWKAFRVRQTTELSLLGVLPKITALLAEHGISIFVVSTYDTDYIFTAKGSYSHALEVLYHSGIL